MTRRQPAWIALALAVVAGCAPKPMSDLARLAGAAESRSTPGRFTGGLPYAPLTAGSRGGVTPPAELLLNVAQIQRSTADAFDATSRATLGVGWALLGDFDQAVAALELAVLQEPANANLQSDLSSAYLGRAASQVGAMKMETTP